MIIKFADIYFLLFLFIIPIAGLVLEILETVDNLKIRKDLNYISKGLESLASNLKDENLSIFDAKMSNWYEASIRQLSTKDAKASLRLLASVKHTGLGEGHRELLESDEKYRWKAIKRFKEISKAYEYGQLERIYEEIGKFISLIYEIEKQDCNNNPKQLTINALKQASTEIKTFWSINSDELIRKTRKEVSNCNLGSDSYSMLLLQWASIILDYEERFPSRYQLIPRGDFISRNLKKVAEKYEHEDYSGAFRLIANSLF